MKISYKWLKTLIDFDMDPHELTERLTMTGHVVDELVYLGQGFDRIVVGRAEAIRSHPGADKLKLVEVSAGGGSKFEVVCGAPNVKVGGCYPLALEGAKLPGGFQIKRSKIRGVESCGMLCSEKELGISEDAAGLMELDSSHSPGTPLAEALGRDDWLLELEVTANRGDMWSHLGAARELQPFVGRKLVLPPSRVTEREPHIGKLTSVIIDDPEGCPRYMARVIVDVKVGPSPRWLVERLESVGQRSINNVVDVTNYILYELGQPLHSFDLDKLEEKRIIVRKARDREKIVTLDGVLRELDLKMTVIADALKPVAVAGVMGDILTEVDENTKRILLECAYFDPPTNRRTNRTLALSTEASKRFERGTDYGLMPYALDRATRLIAEVSSGSAVAGTIDVYPVPIPVKEINLRGGRIRRVLGVGFSEDEVRKWLEGVDFAVEKKDQDLYRVKVPSCRHLDVRREEDLIEELARLWGYENIPVPSRMDVTLEVSGRQPHYREMDLRRALCGIGFQEVMTSAFVSSDYAEKIYGPGYYAPLRLLSPISIEEDVLRPTLVPSLLACLERNLNQRHTDLRLFEIGSVFSRRPGQQGTGEEKHLGIVVTGGRYPVHWSGPAKTFDFFDLKGVLESLFSHLKMPAPKVTNDVHPVLHPGTAASIEHRGEKIGCIGRIDPALAHKLELPDEIYLLEINLEPLVSEAVEPVYEELSPFPGSRRDLSILVDESVPCADLISQIRKASNIVTDVTVFDLYQGDHVPPGKKSLAMSVLFGSPERTLRDEEVDKVFGKIFKTLVKKFGVKPR
ncbi:MAG TPA: phenylalanine--tRNA ligase subunit beta [archaeon]|nr:phenylalanine--tRNA ligase subunit beta [archaeon]